MQTLSQRLTNTGGMNPIREATRCLRTIRDKNPTINAFVRLRPDHAVLAEAHAAHLRHQSGSPASALDGLTFAVKDNLCTKDVHTSCSSRTLIDFKPGYDATVVAKLRECGAILLGKANMDEFGMGSDSTHSCFGSVRNPSSPEHSILSAGGSSGGSAAAVASHMCFGALGSDTGGSIRLPASYCGIVGFKPSYGLLSRRGLITYAHSLDTVGILARDVRSARLIFDCLNAYDESDPVSMNEVTRCRIKRQASSHRPKATSRHCWKIGVPLDYNISELSSKIRNAWASTLATLRDLGHEIIPLSIPSARHAICAYYIIALAEASSNLAKYDGIRFGLSPGATLNIDVANPLGKIIAAREEGFGQEVQRRILLGNYSLTSEAMESYFIHAQKIRRLVIQDFDRIFAFPNPLNAPPNIDLTANKRADVLISPVSVSSAPNLHEVVSPSRSALDAYLNDVFTIPASMAGLPALSVPANVEGGLPLSLHLMAQYGDEDGLFEIATLLQDIT